MKKFLALLLVLVMIVPTMVACKKDEKPAGEAAADVEMKYIEAKDLKENLGSDEYTILDVRKKEDYDKARIPGSISADMDVVVSGNDTKAGLEVVKKAIEGVDNKLVLVCYSGKRYAQATTNALKEAGYDMEKVFTLKDGFKNWETEFADDVEK